MKIKKVLTFILILLIVLFSKEVFADMSAPEIKPYTAYVSNPEGADYYQYDAHADGYKKVGNLEYGTEINVEYETTENGIEYAEFCMDNNYIIRIEDIKMVKEEIAENNEINFDEPIQIRILAKDGVKIHNGPAYIYSVIGTTIPTGTELTAYIHNFEDPWYYVTYKDTSGWICILNGVIGQKAGVKELILPKSTKIYEDNECKNPIKEIPANTIITDYWNVDMWSRNYYVTYKGISGYISAYDCATNDDWSTEIEWTLNYNDAKMYKEGSLNSEVLIKNIPVGTALKAEYATDIRMSGWIYTTYNNKKGWVFIVEDGYYYEEAVEQELQDEKLRNGEIIETQEENNSETNNITNELNTIDPNNNIITNEVITTSTHKVLPLEMILICVFIGIIVGATGITILLLINKKRK